MGNLDDGDCVPAFVSHIEMVHGLAHASSWKKLLYRTGFVVPTNTLTLDDYHAYLATLGEKGNDVGVDPSNYLAYLKTRGQIKDWGSSALDEASVRETMASKVGCGLTLELTPRAYNRVYDHLPWDISPGDKPDPSLYHEVALVAYGENYGVVTWGQMKTMTPLFLNTCIRGCNWFQ